MPLTEAEQKELEGLKAKRSELVGTETTEQLLSLNPEEQQELQQLKQRRIEIIGQQSTDQEKTNQLLDILNGKLPSMEPEKLPPFAARPGPLSDVGRLTRQQEAFTELQNTGMSPEQIKLASQTRKVLGGARIGRGIGGVSGAIGATAIAGRFIPGPIDDAVIMLSLIAAGGAGIGGVAGEAAQTGIEEKRMIGKREALKAFAIEVVTELGGRAIAGGGKLLFSPFIKKTIPAAAALVDDYAKFSGQFSPTELDKRFSLRVGEAFSRGSFGAKEIFQEFEEKQGKAVLAYADGIIESIGEGVARQSPEEIGQVFAEGISRPGGRIFKILDDLFDPLFKQVDDLAQSGSQAGFRQIKKGGPAIRGAKGQFQVARELQKLQLKPTVSTDSLKAFAKKQLATDKRLNGQFLSGVGRTKFQGMLGLNKKLTFSDMRTLRSTLLKDVRKMARDVDQSQGLIKQLAGITDNAIFDPKAAQGLNPEALNLLRNTNALYKASQKGLESTFSSSLSKRLLKNPSRVIKELFPNNNPKSIRLLRKSLVEPISGKPSQEGKVLWNQLRQAWLADVVDQATKEGVAKPKVFDGLIRKLGKSFSEMFPEKEIAANVKKIQSLFDIAGKAPPTGASLFSRGAQVGGIALMYDSGKKGDFVGFTVGGIMALGPLAFAKLATTPRGIKFLTAGFKMKPGASGLVPNTVRIIRLLREMNTKENQSRKNTEQRKSFLTRQAMQRRR